MKHEFAGMTIEELESTLIVIKNEIISREPANEFTIEFEHTADPRKGKPYAARLFWNEEAGKLDREFFQMSQEYGKKEVTVSGQYKTKMGDIVEERTGGSWKNDYRYWYLTLSDGTQKRVAEISDSSEKTKVQKYLKGKIEASELL